MTREMIELEFAHIALDQKLKGGNTEQYEDPDFEDYDKETEELDSRLSDDELPDYSPLVALDTEDADEWEDVEVENT